MNISDKEIQKLRDFNRFFTTVIGVLDNHILDSPFSLAEARVLFEINNTTEATARGVNTKINMDEGYLSRIIEKFVKNGLLKKTRSSQDGRAYILTPTRKGMDHYQAIDNASNASVRKMLEPLSAVERKKLVELTSEIKVLLLKNYER